MRITEKPEITTYIILEKRVLLKGNLHPVKLVVYDQNKRKFYTVKNHRYTSEEFEAIHESGVRGKRKKERSQLQEIEKRARLIIDEVLPTFSFSTFEREYKTKQKKETYNLAYFFEQKIKELNDLNKIQTATLYNATQKSLQSYDSKIELELITPNYLTKYQNWMIEEENSYTTIGMYLRNLKRLINLAIKSGVNIEYPFGNPKDGLFQIPEGKNTKKALTIDEVRLIFQYSPESKNEELALNYWLFSYMSNGMNMVDIANLQFKNIKGNNIEFIRQKTKDTSKEVSIIKVLLLDEIKEIINQIGNKSETSNTYIFPVFTETMTGLEKHNKLRQFIKTTNKYMRVIAKNLDLNESITTYWARHSYSTILKRSGAPIEFISEQLGHQDTKTTQSYLDSFEDEHRAKYSANLIPK